MLGIGNRIIGMFLLSERVTGTSLLFFKAKIDSLSYAKLIVGKKKHTWGQTDL